MSEAITIIGGGLAGSEAAWQVARHGGRAHLYEMRPEKTTPAHTTDQLAEIVCSNSLKSNLPYNASWLLKQELRQAGSLLIEIADKVRVPAGGAFDQVPEVRLRRGLDRTPIQARQDVLRMLELSEMRLRPVAATGGGNLPTVQIPLPNGKNDQTRWSHSLL